jgi:hypothetical protein
LLLKKVDFSESETLEDLVCSSNLVRVAKGGFSEFMGGVEAVN